MFTTSFHINGFWFHVKWDAQGKIGKDQHGDTWYNSQNPRSEMGGMRPMPARSWNSQPAANTKPSYSAKPSYKAASNKDYFLQNRERSHEYYHSRSAMMK